MKPLPSSPPTLARAECVALAFALAALAGLHLVNASSVGPLWRDEIGDVVYASMRSWGEIWARLKYDNFPPGLLVVLRAWQGCGLAEAGAVTGYRVGGLLVGGAVVAAFWFTARTLGARAPFFSLGLLLVSGLVIRVGDSVRPYGLGWLWIVLTFGLLWRVAREERPGWRVVVPAAVTAVLGVQCLYQDTFLLFGIGVAGMIVAARAGRWRAVAAVAGIGALAAVSVLPYALGPVREAAPWSMIARSGLSWTRMEHVSWMALASSGDWRPWVWIAATVGLGAWTCGRWRQERREVVLYAGLAAGIVLPLFVVFLKGLAMSTSTWYYLPPLLIAASALDVLGDTLHAAPRTRWVPVAFLVLTVGLSLPGTWREVRERVTNSDLLAAQVAQLAKPDDLIVVSPAWFGVSFQYYYRGKTPWSTLPPLADHTIHRFDLVKERMESPGGDGPLLARVGETLQAGHRVWLAGYLNLAPVPHSAITNLKPAPDPVLGWNEAAYMSIWTVQLREFLHDHATRAGVVPVPVPGGQTVNESEWMRLFVMEGWQP